MIQCRGHYEDGLTSRSWAGHLQWTEGAAQIILDDDQPPIEVPVASLRVSDRLGALPIRISMGEGRAFVTHDHEAVDRLPQRLSPGRAANAVSFLEQRLSIALLSLTLVVGLLAGALLWGLPAASRTLAERLPAAALDAAGNEVLAALDKLHFSPSQLPLERQAALEDRLRRFDDHPAAIAFRQGGKTIGANAFALPGRIVVLTDELIELARDESEITAVYLHEVGHLRGRHAEAAVIQGSLWIVVLTLITGDVSGVVDVLYVLPSTISQLAFSRRLEQEADAYAVNALNGHGLSAEPLAVILERLTGEAAAEDGWQRYLSTHPGTAERIAHVRALNAP